jgi:hydrogenase nickel incorporation protein HypA/HybF
MHELGIAESIFDIVRQHVPEEQAAAVRDVRVRVGEASGVLAESLEFCFGAIVAGTPWQSAHLAIERVAPAALCWGCGLEFPTGVVGARCPECASDDISLVAGRDLQVVDVEIADGQAQAKTA